MTTTSATSTRTWRTDHVQYHVQYLHNLRAPSQPAPRASHGCLNPPALIHARRRRLDGWWERPIRCTDCQYLAAHHAGCFLCICMLARSLQSVFIRSWRGLCVCYEASSSPCHRGGACQTQLCFEHRSCHVRGNPRAPSRADVDVAGARK